MSTFYLAVAMLLLGVIVGGVGTFYFYHRKWQQIEAAIDNAGAAGVKVRDAFDTLTGKK
jgi:uncharacterized membrane protein